MNPPCEHEVFSAHVGVHRVMDEGQPLRFIADVEIHCEQCKENFRFLGVPAGISFEQPRVNITGTMLQAPIEPELIPMLHTKYRVDVPPEIP